MPCVRISGPGFSAIVCRVKGGPRCRWCRQPAEILCDWPTGPRGTCSARLCPAHAAHMGPGRDLCPDHAAQLRAAPPQSALACGCGGVS